MKIILFSFLLLLSHLCAYSQVEKFVPDTISNNGVFANALSPDMNEIYFVNSGNTRDRLKIMVSRCENGRWTTPELASFSAGEFRDIDPFISPDGRTMIFNSNRPLDPNSTAPKKEFDIWFADRTPQGWSAPYHAGMTINSDSSDFYATVALSGNMYYVSRREGNNDIYLSEYVEGKYTTPKKLDAIINTQYSESNPYISPAENFMIFFSDRPGGKGNSDLYISYCKNGRWSKPQNLGNLVNTAGGEFCPFISMDGKYFYFSRSEFENGKRVRENIYRVSTKFLPIKKKHLRFDL